MQIRTRFVVLIVVACSLLLCWTPVFPIAWVLISNGIGHVFPAGPRTGTRYLYVRINSVPVHGIADDAGLWVAVAVRDDSAVQVSHGRHVPTDGGSTQKPRQLPVCMNRQSPLLWNDVELELPKDTRVVAVDFDGVVHGIHLSDVEIDQLIDAGSSTSSIPPELTLAQSDFERVNAELYEKELLRVREYLESHSANESRQ